MSNRFFGSFWYEGIVLYILREDCPHFLIALFDIGTNVLYSNGWWYR